MKSPLIHENIKFCYSKNKKSILFHGTIINKCESLNESGKIKALAINIGFNTNRGNLIQNILFPQESNFSFYSDIRMYFYFIPFQSIISIILIFYFFFKIRENCDPKCDPKCDPICDPKCDPINKLIWKLGNIFVTILPPSFPICMTFTSFYFHYNLNKKNVSCISDQKMNAAGRVNIIVLDKTGTLTEEGLELYGLQTTRVVPFTSEKTVEFDEVEQTSKILNEVHKEFWKKYCINPKESVFDDYQNSIHISIVFFVECLASCHSIDKFKGETLGNSVDKKIYDFLGWKIEKSDDSNEYIGILKYDMIPKNFHKITEDSIFNSNRNSILGRQYKLTIIKRFEFSSKFQSNSVIIYNHLDRSYRYFIKGAPEKIMQICNPNSLPDNFSKELSNQTQNGYRVLACATKPLEDKSGYEFSDDREIYENNLNFLGFIIFKNKLKRDTKNIICKLNRSDCKLIIATGDNPFTTISVARECEFVDYNQDIYLCNLEKHNNLNLDRLKWYNIKMNREIIFSPSIIDIKTNKESLKVKSEQKSKKIKQLSYINDKTINNPETSEINTHRKFLEEEKSNIELVSRRNLQTDDKKTHEDFIEKEFSNSFLHPSVKEEYNLFLEKIEKEDNSILCLTGKAFEYILVNYKEERKNYKKNKNLLPKEELLVFNRLAKILKTKTKIFSRMNPSNKVNLVNFLKEDKTNIIAMCGDGANDCGALLSADIGISIAHQKGANITAHFYSSEKSISCVELILKNGRACFENSLIIVKFTLLYGTIQNSSCILLASQHNKDLTDNQYLFIDCFVVLITCLLVSKTGANNKLICDSLNDRFYRMKFLLSLTGQIFIQLIGQILFFFLYLTNSSKIVPTSTCDNQLENLNSYFFIFCVFQLFSVILVFNSNSKHRKQSYANKLYILYISLIFFLSMILLTGEYEFLNFLYLVINNNDLLEDKKFTDIKKIITVLSIIVNSVITYLYEILLKYLLDKN